MRREGTLVRAYNKHYKQKHLIEDGFNLAYTFKTSTSTKFRVSNQSRDRNRGRSWWVLFPTYTPCVISLFLYTAQEYPTIGGTELADGLPNQSKTVQICLHTNLMDAYFLFIYLLQYNGSLFQDEKKIIVTKINILK